MLQNQNSSKANRLIGLALVILITTSLDLAADFSNPPVRCEGFGDLDSFLLMKWESGLGLWTVGTHDTVVDFDTPPWVVVGNLPDGRTGKAAFVADQDDWEICDLEDKSGALTLDSPQRQIPSDTLVPRISVDHWFATERDSDGAWDGGNFKISLDGGATFTLIPASAIEYGPYNETLLPPELEGGGELNTNPLAGQEAYSGPVLQWGQSHINLLGIAAAGDNIILRFDFGIDECAGDIGWYVDDEKS